MDPTLSGGNDGGKRAPVLGDNPRLQQSTDAVPMENMSPTTASATDVTKAVDALEEPENFDAEPSSTVIHAPADADRTNTKDQVPTADAVSKGKEKEDAAPALPTKQRSDSILAIGPAQDHITAAPGNSEGPVCNITLLLTSGSRHPYKIDAQYLTRRNVAMPDDTEAGLPDPFSISIYTLKELILREWRSDWEAKPASPSSIRLIHFGKLLDDKEQLKKYQFSTENPNVVHMSIRPQDLDEEEPKSGSKSLPASSGDGQRSRSGGMCCVIL
ncbi:hypothetical protein C2857_007213 [Epichloe festucae Fl1]|uniref:UBL3-like ubiquitin domain-containing protein n=1 Tax=Epichloe festucae (strain Fl1) TaxID=877507 RepID=A0A7S9KM68_EPIFF|nr:hypothetical protein C2857_007213 [Epichloe festucae Fl1]